MAWELTGNTNINNANFLGSTDNNPLAIRTNDQDRVVVDVNGNVGIGTSAPKSKLDIHAHDGLQIIGFQPFQTLIDSSNGKSARIQHANRDVVFLQTVGFLLQSPQW
jgi:hypothetical protein